MRVTNPSNNRKYSIEFVIVDNDDFTPLLGSKTSQQMGLITVNTDKFVCMNVTTGLPRSETKSIRDEFADVFDGSLGTFPGTVHLEIDSSITPSILPPRRVPHAIKDQLKGELDDMVILSPVEKPTEWVSQFVVCRKKSGKLRVCIYPKPLNRALKREHHLQVMDDVLPCLNKAKVFTKLDLASAFWHIQLDEESSFLTTFNTPFGRYRWLRLPFGIRVSSEIFQKHLNQVLEGLFGVVCIADDIVVYGCGETMEEAQRDHDDNQADLLKRCREKNVKLSYEKSMFNRAEIPFMGHLITSEGLKPDPAKIDAVAKMAKPTDVKSIQRFIGFVTYLSRFLPDLSDSLRESGIR